MNKCFCDICGKDLCGDKPVTLMVTKHNGDKVQVTVATTLIIDHGETAGESYLDTCAECECRAAFKATSPQ